MSGGAFDYIQYRIDEVADQLAKHAAAEDFQYSNSTRGIFVNTVERLKYASVLLNRIDWLLSGDDGEKTFYKRLEDDLNKVSQKLNKDRVWGAGK